MLDVVYLATTVALFALVGLVVKGVERLLGPPARSSAPREATRTEERG